MLFFSNCPFPGHTAYLILPDLLSTQTYAIAHTSSVTLEKEVFPAGEVKSALAAF